ncbi:hypothetical protein TL16_g07052 [Triparma laevis f. inornata]|uniref:Uncharacterized protein n=2 Tax=Triparma laevis TaxID=1534972 RepID=A0A9W7A1K1_9STRA|nr:hypothetical protein TrLO_g8103 [Triparma laevis f. longispina]GMH76352.1 hypothetical protein TL16_g07052 [Triparma laevis f. inornata]
MIANRPWSFCQGGKSNVAIAAYDHDSTFCTFFGKALVNIDSAVAAVKYTDRNTAALVVSLHIPLSKEFCLRKHATAYAKKAMGPIAAAPFTNTV